MTARPDVPDEWIDRLGTILTAFPECTEERAWVGFRWRVRGSTVAHVFGGEDQLFRLIFRAEPGEVPAFENLGHPYFRVDWGESTVGIMVDEETDWDEVTELLTDSYCVQAPASLAALVERPEPGAG
ncbi:MmcQ/YjbR family DNA-binding protein [Tsukamurella sp. 1534]|uniref:MmcQ/YjbR family DNA-binding protein n=1 Tax=Tsukamurella sp. 1534 TaxID=1151061 RepID=UPI0002F504D4|nr:MmcQ/YjbR family DNA-binding protein [Tsukamurella sp. 1534]